jgi:hypothetical protein
MRARWARCGLQLLQPLQLDGLRRVVGRAAAGVPGRELKTKERASKPTSSISFIVLAKSSSVSPGKPTMKSDDRLMPGRTARSLRMMLLYSSAV